MTYDSLSQPIDPNGADPGASSYPPPPYPSQQLPAYPPAGYPPQGYPQQGYPPQGYPPPGYPAAYPTPGYPAQSYPAQSYPAQGNYPVGYPPNPYDPGGYPPPTNRRPGLVTAAAILAWVAGGLLILGAVLLLTNTFRVYDDNNLDNPALGSKSGFQTFGVINLVLAAVLIIAGLRLVNRTASGRALIISAAGGVVITGIAWISWIAVPAVIFWAIIFWALAILSAAFLSGTQISRWFAGHDDPVNANISPYPRY
jgi:hypothetical protein